MVGTSVVLVVELVLAEVRISVLIVNSCLVVGASEVSVRAVGGGRYSTEERVYYDE